jgi:hypothetical protein
MDRLLTSMSAKSRDIGYPWVPLGQQTAGLSDTHVGYEIREKTIAQSTFDGKPEGLSKFHNTEAAWKVHWRRFRQHMRETSEPRIFKPHLRRPMLSDPAGLE